MSKIQIELEDLKRVFFFLEEANGLFHQPLDYNDNEIVDAFARKNYDEIKDLYYNVIWDLLPEEVQKEIEDR